MTDIIDRLREVANTKTGDPLPESLNGPNGWGEPLCALLNDAIAEIERERRIGASLATQLRRSMEKNATLANAAMDKSFREIKQEIKNAS